MNKQEFITLYVGQVSEHMKISRTHNMIAPEYTDGLFKLINKMALDYVSQLELDILDDFIYQGKIEYYEKDSDVKQTITSIDQLVEFIMKG